MSKTDGMTDLKHLTNIRAWVKFGATKDKPSVADQQSFAFLDQLIKQAEKIEAGESSLKVMIYVAKITSTGEPVVNVSGSYKDAYARVVQYAKDNWDNREDGTAPEDPDSLDDQDVVTAYFDGNVDDSYWITSGPIAIPPGALTLEVVS